MLKPLHTVILLLAVAFALPSADSLAQESEPSSAPVLVRLETTSGDITLRLLEEKSPTTTANFLAYVDSGHYDGTIFHRVIPNFMIQGGGFDTRLIEKPTGEPIVNESINKLHNIRGTVAMARTGDPDSAAAQFFINQRSNLRLDWAPGRAGYTVFGEVVDGLNVVDFIATAPTGDAMATQVDGRKGPLSDVPLEPIIIKRAFRVTSD
ncbi:peptidyl-prolyl cis-trans isomerase A [Luminiphilus syltensis NOR5-1B]|uniref:Peptidyl-prolyl cis-trans isomerase n=1 Tax=Luminiphilus syltensis NOR5-1B TaxID=565045 RepID=B8KQK4_9GAMM|nr:peptidylprolyl isomerase [Luminiphilus syltensis]EED36964.1 peptidyl-prolyl cis-trans isomerase A [Luminiphilus syltensis NOR5-1B]